MNNILSDRRQLLASVQHDRRRREEKSWGQILHLCKCLNARSDPSPLLNECNPSPADFGLARATVQTWGSAEPGSLAFHLPFTRSESTFESL